MTRGWWSQVPAAVARNPHLTPSAKAVYLALASHADRQGGSCFPSHATLAVETGLSERTVKRCLDELRDAGAVEWKRTGRSNRYRILKGEECRSDRPPVSEQIGRGGPTSKSPSTDPENKPLPAPQAATVSAGAEEPLFDAPPVTDLATKRDEAAEQEKELGQKVRAVWFEAWVAAYGSKPDQVVVNKALGRIRLAIRARTDLASWRALYTACVQAGRAGRWDVDNLLAPARPSMTRRSGANYMTNSDGPETDPQMRDFYAMLGFDPDRPSTSSGSPVILGEVI